MKLKLALPKGRLLPATALMLEKAGLGISGYEENSRSYRPQCSHFPNLSIKIFHEKDIPIQVAVSNYDLGICGLDWVEELLTKYPSSALVKVRNLGYGKGILYLATSRFSGISSLKELEDGMVRIASEYPNLAEAFALKIRLRRFKIFPLWGASEVYPPESADLVLVFSNNLLPPDLVPLAPILESNAFLIANKNSWESKDMSHLLEPLYAVGNIEEAPRELKRKGLSLGLTSSFKPTLRLALPDGHQQEPVMEFLNRAGIRLEGLSRHPTINLDNTLVKIIRPQDMPLQVANRNFDLAITGEDWLYDHLYRFPSSPVKQILRLGCGIVRIVAVVSNELPANSIQDLKERLKGRDIPIIRIASEYVNIADRYAWNNHLSPYRIIPTWGASEAFLPEDADLLIENTQTGQTISQHNLKIIDTLFESSACLIGNKHKAEGAKEEKISSIIQALLKAGATSKGEF